MLYNSFTLGPMLPRKVWWRFRGTSGKYCRGCNSL